MDFQTLNRRELQSLCKLNKIPANITNIAMIDALKSLETVIGIEEIMNSSTESPEKIEVTSPRVPRTSCRTSTRQKVKKSEAESLIVTACSTSRGIRLFPKTPSVSGTRKKALTTSCQNAESQLNECEEVAKNECLVDQEMKCIPNTPVAVPTTYSRRKGTMTSTRQDTVKKENTVQRVYSTRRSARLTEKKCAEPGVVNREISQPVKIDSSFEEVSVTSEEDSGIKAKVEDICNVFEKLDVLLDGSDCSNIKKALQVDTTLESGEEKEDGCVEFDNLNVKLIDIIEQHENVGVEEKHIVREKFVPNEVVDSEEISGKVGNSKAYSECISNPCKDGDSENLMLDEKLCSVNLGPEEHLDSLLHDKVLSEADGIDVEAIFFDTKNPVSTNLSEDLIHNNHNVAKEMTAELEGVEENISRNDVDVVLVNPNVQEPNMDFETPEEAQESLIKETAADIMPPAIYQEVQEIIVDADKVTHESAADVSSIKEENQFSTNANDVIDHPTHLTPIKNSPTLMKGTADNNDNSGRNRQEVIAEEDKSINKTSVDEKPMSLNETSMRQLKKQLKALSIKNNMNTNKDITVTEARPALQVVCNNQLATGEEN